MSIKTGKHTEDSVISAISICEPGMVVTFIRRSFTRRKLQVVNNRISFCLNSNCYLSTSTNQLFSLNLC